MASAWALTGRDEVLSRIDDLMLGAGAGVLLVGDAGVGKSRLASEAAEGLARRGYHVVKVSGLAATAALPLAAVAPILPAEAVDSGLPALLSFRRALELQSDGRPVVLTVDDADRLDEASAALVYQVAASGDAKVIATQRSGTAAPDVVARLWWDGLVARVEIGPLDRSHTVALAEQMSRRPLPPEVADRIWALSAGNPLFVRELALAGLAPVDHPSTAGPGYDVDAVLTEPDSGRLGEVIERRLADLGHAARDVLALVAFGEPLGAGELESAGAGEALVELERSGLVTADEEDRRLVIRVAHPFYGEVLRNATPADERKDLLFRLAAGLQATGARRRGDHLRLATWAIESGLDVGHEVLTDGARVARFSDDLELAEHIAREAYSRHPSFEGGELLADVLYNSGDGPATLAHIADWRPLALTEDERAMVGITEAVTHYWYAGDLAAATRALDGVEPDSAGTYPPSAVSDQVGEARGVRATFLAFGGHPAEALRLAQPLVHGPPGRAHIQGAIAASQALRSLLRPNEALAVLEGASAIYAGLGEQGLLIGEREMGAARVADLVDAGRFDDAEALTENLFDRFAHRGEKSRTGHMLLSEGWLRLQQGRTGAAVQALDASARAFGALRHWGMQRWPIAASALAHAQRGEIEPTRIRIDEAEQSDGHPAKVFDQSLHRARGWLAWLEGDSDAARRFLLDGADLLAATGDRAGEVTCLHDVARLGYPSEVVDRVSAAVVDTDSDWYRLLADHTSALARDDQEAMALVAERFATTGAWLLASESAYSAERAASAAGDARAAAAWSVRGEQWRSKCDAVRSPALVAASAPVPLTRREREVAVLAAEGLSRREMADRLYVGVRTVDSHLVRIYAKLGVRSRTDLAAALDSGAGSNNE